MKKCETKVLAKKVNKKITTNVVIKKPDAPVAFPTKPAESRIWRACLSAGLSQQSRE